MTSPPTTWQAAPAGSAPRRGLGRGLGSLIPTSTSLPPGAPTTGAPTSGAPATGAAATAPPGDHLAGRDTATGLQPVLGATYAELPVDAIVPNPRQPRQVFDEEALAELVASIREVGLLQPVVVRRASPEGFELVMGERRWRAAREAGLATLPAIVRETGNDALLRDALLENLHRAQLNPLEEAAAYQQLLDDFGCTHEELASRIGRSRPQITNTLRLLKLTPVVQRRVSAGVLSAGHARTLLAVPDAEEQEALAGRVVAEGISVRGLEELVTLRHPAGQRTPPSRRSGAGGAPEEYAELATRLGDRYDTRVRINGGRHRGRIMIDFASPEDLRRILQLLEQPDRQV